MADEKRFKAAPKKHYYALIDGTLAGDSAIFGHKLETAGHGRWANLLDFLPLIGKTQFGVDSGRLDPGDHLPFLPIYQVNTTQTAPMPDRRQTIPVVMPNGFNGTGKDPFWKAYSEGDSSPADVARFDHPDSGITYGRHTACEKSARFINGTFFLIPGVEVHSDQQGTSPSGKVITHGMRAIPIEGRRQFYAELLYMSSHGFKGGYAVGDALEPYLAAEPKSVPEQDAQPATKRYSQTSPYFAIGDLAERGEGFRGPKWIVLALCSAVNPGTWPLWVRVFERSFPQVRGILAYEKSAPGDGGGVAKTFFSLLSAGKTFLEAWKLANTSSKWSAIVHHKAVGDTLSGWDTLPELGTLKTTAAQGGYKGYNSTDFKQGAEIRFGPPPFGLRLFEMFFIKDEDGKETGETFDSEILSKDLHTNAFGAGVGYRVELESGDAKAVEQVELQWINIRDDYPKQPSYSKVFQAPQPKSPGIQAKLTGSKVVLTPTGAPPSKLAVMMRAKEDLSQAHIEDGYLWLRASMKVAGEAQPRKHDFVLKGLPT